MAANNFQRTMKTLKEASSPNSKSLALTSLRRMYLEDKKLLKIVNDKEFCELCNSILNASVTEDDKLHIEACRTLDIVLSETKNRNFDFFQSILQINRKKRLKVLVSLSILKDETVATITNNTLSISEFLNDCLQFIEPSSMIWLLPENADNGALLKIAENKALSETDDFEAKVVDRALQLLCRLCSLSSIGLNIRQFDSFIMEKVIILGYMGHRKQRSQALAVLKQAVHNDLGVRIRSLQRDVWEKYKNVLQTIYCKRMTLLVHNNDQDWAIQWETSISLIGTDLHRGSGLVNSLLKVEELAFKSADPNRRQAFLSWKLLIDNFALDQRELATTRRIKLLCVPLNAKNSKTESMVLTKLEVWWHLIYKIYPSISECIDPIMLPFLNICFGPFGDKPLFIQKMDTNVSLGKKFQKTQIYAINAFVQLLISKESRSKMLLPIIQDQLPGPVNNSVFESIYKIFIHCFGEILLIMGLMPDEDIINKVDVYTTLWDNIINRIEEYDKLKIPMYKEIMNVIIELIKNQFYKIPMIRNFLINVVLKNFHNISKNVTLSRNTAMDLIQTFLQVDNFSKFTNDHYKSIETLFWNTIKPNNSNLYYPEAMDILKMILKMLGNTKRNIHNMSAIYEIWCILAQIAKKYVEDSQNINEGTHLEHNFNTFENIIAFPFINPFIDNLGQLKAAAEIWLNLYKQFDFQVELIVSVKPNEVLNKTSNIILSAITKNKKPCDFAAACIDGLLNTVNYDNLLNETETPTLVQLFKVLIVECLDSSCFITDRVLQTLSVFLLRVFTHSAEKTALYLKILEPTIKHMLTKVDDNSTESEICSTWKTVVGLFKKLQQHLNFELLSCYQKTIVTAMLHLNKDISSTAFSILDLKDNIDEKSKKVLENVIIQLEETSVKNNYNADDTKEKTKKIKQMHIKPVGSFLSRRTMSPSSANKIKDNGKENVEKMKAIEIEPNSQDFVVINNDIKLDVNKLTDHQKEMLKKRRDDIPAMYNELTVSNSQDSQELQRWFDAKTSKSPIGHKNELSSNNNTSKIALPSTLQFKNITQVLTNTQKKVDDTLEKPVSVVLTEIQTAKQLEEDVEVSTIEDSQKNGVENSVNIAKKLDFESREEFPIEGRQVSPSLIEHVKVRRKQPVEENNGVQDKNIRMTRRSLQPQGTLRKFNSNEQLNKRGRKRRNSETNSEGAIHIEREKRSRKSVIQEVLNSSGESVRSNEEQKIVEFNDGNVTKRQKKEMSRLKIDMRFEALPSRRSAGKLHETNTDKKTATAKDEKSKEDKTSITAMPVTNSQHPQQILIVQRRSMRGAAVTTVTKMDEKVELNNKKDNETKNTPEILPDNQKSGTRKSLSAKVESTLFKQKYDIVEETQEDLRSMEKFSTPMENSEKVHRSKNKNPDLSKEENSTELKSQDSDIVESSQEQSATSKMDKVDCFIKIRKVDIAQNAIAVEEMLEKVEKISDVPSVDSDTTSVIVESVAEDSEKSIVTQTDLKKVDSNLVKQSIPGNHISSPKSANSRVFRSKGFPLQGRAAQMLGLVTKQSMTEKLAADASKLDTVLIDEVTIMPISKKEKAVKDNDRVSSPSGGSRQEKMFSNMNSTIRQERCSSPLIMTFCNLKNNGERISPKLDKQERESEDMDADEETMQNAVVNNDESPNGKGKKELPLLEWTNANPPSLTASPSASILKRMLEVDADTPNRKKRVSFADPPVSREMGYEIITESSSPPKLEKLPSSRSPISRKESKRYSKLRLMQVDVEKPNDSSANDETITISNNDALSVAPKLKLLTVLSQEPTDDSKCIPSESNVEVQTQDQDIFVYNDNASSNDLSVEVKTSTQNDQNNSSIKLDSINLSNILQKSDNHQNSLEDTVDVDNISSSLDGTSSISDKPVSTCQQSGGESGDTLPVTDSVFSNLPLSQETQNCVAQLIQPEALDSTLPVYPSLISCVDGVDRISSELVDPLFTNHLAKHLSVKSIRSVGDLAQLTERDINRLPIKSPKLDCVKKALSKYEEKLATKSPERKTTASVSSSTPLGNKIRSKSKTDNSFDDLIKGNNSDLASIDVSSLYECKRPSKRQSIDSSMQTSPMKRSKKTNEEACIELMDQCDENFLFETFMKRFNSEKILKGYKEKMAAKSEKELKSETLSILGLSSRDDSEASFNVSSKTMGLKRVLQQLPKLFEADEEFYTSVLEVYQNKLRAANVLNFLKIADVKKTVSDKFNAIELLGILSKRLLHDEEKGINKSFNDTSDLRLLLSRISPTLIINEIKRNSELNTSEVLLNVILKNISENLSEDTKRTMFKTLISKSDLCELADMYNDAIKSRIRMLEKK